MYKNKKTNVAAGMSGSLIIVIFVCLCLTIFSVLSFAAARSDLKLSEKTLDIMSDYYEMNGRAQEKLERINNIIYGLTENKRVLFNKSVCKALKSISGITVSNVSNDDSDLLVSYDITGNKNQEINVILVISYDEKTDVASYKISSWSLSNIEIPDYDEDTYNLWEGND